MGAHGWLTDSGSQLGGRGVSWSRGPSVEAVTGGSVCFSASGSRIEFHCSMMELKLPHTPHPSREVGAGSSLQMCVQHVGRAAMRLEQWGSVAGRGRHSRDTSWLWISTKIQQALRSYFHKTRSANTERTCITLSLNQSNGWFQVSQLGVFFGHPHLGSEIVLSGPDSLDN